MMRELSGHIHGAIVESIDSRVLYIVPGWVSCGDCGVAIVA